MNLLIVDDNAQIRQVIKAVLADLTEEIYECADGEEAAASFFAHTPDWVLMDIEMPGCDGLTATRRIIEAAPQARVVIVTVSNHPGLRQAACAAGACAYVLKENLFDLRQLLTNQTKLEPG